MKTNFKITKLPKYIRGMNDERLLQFEKGYVGYLITATNNTYKEDKIIDMLDYLERYIDDDGIDWYIEDCSTTTENGLGSFVAVVKWQHETEFKKSYKAFKKEIQKKVTNQELEEIKEAEKLTTETPFITEEIKKSAILLTKEAESQEFINLINALDKFRGSQIQKGKYSDFLIWIREILHSYKSNDNLTESELKRRLGIYENN